MMGKSSYFGTTSKIFLELVLKNYKSKLLKNYKKKILITVFFEFFKIYNRIQHE